LTIGANQSQLAKCGFMRQNSHLPTFAQPTALQVQFCTAAPSAWRV